MADGRRMLGFPLLPPRVPGIARVGRVPTGRTVELPGRGRTYMVDSGPVLGAPTFLLLHSLACTGLMTWYPTLAMMRQFGRVVTFDQRGHGQGIRSSRFLLEDCADDAAALADVLGVQTFVPVGYSMGSLVAQLVWRRHPQRVDGLVLCAATAAYNRASYERLATGVFGALIEAVSPQPGLPATPGATEEFITNDSHWLLSQLRSTSVGAISQAIAELMRFDSTPWVAEIDVPTSVLITMRDRAFGIQRQLWLATHIPDAHIVTVEAGHAGCTLQPSKFVPGLHDAVDSVHRRIISKKAS
ncbi:alpha/beta fold hydrolase [Mycobacterium sp. E2733]|uniref:alpha/beta fold hydrolase n=1 Tax=Mycobacterium sp. E2733 TaxID=1834138 RepID=UPI0007FC869F|nr:alpha/beta hydrolase [Mycobacterium sp. E2733]OBI00518.1 alpha/beta hydrolase [Mycobacterium sp. E2733]